MISVREVDAESQPDVVRVMDKPVERKAPPEWGDVVI